MGTAKFDDGTASNPKLIAAGATAAWLWFCGVLYCRRGLTDGFIPKIVVPTLSVGLVNPFKHAARLVEVGLWHEAIGGYQVHDYLDWNPTKEAMSEYRRRDRERKHGKQGIREEAPDGFRVESERIPNDAADEHARAGRAPARSHSHSQSGFGNSVVGEESAREGELPPRWTHTPSSRQSALVGRHIGCFSLTPSACARGICVPNWLGQQWRQQYGTELQQADHVIREVVEAAISALPETGPIGDEPKHFWHAVWKAAHGSQAPQASMGRGQLTLDAAKRVALARLQRSGRAS